jgi:uncharacterized protein (TIGR00375 family)
MEIIADFHIHSKYSRATSAQMEIEYLDLAARKKGVQLLGTGDFTHPLWLLELKKKLEPFAEGIYRYGETFFILTCEVCNIFYRQDKAHQIHNVIFSPDFESVDEINKFLSSYGDLYADGRPLLRLEPSKMLKNILDINPLNFVVPAHIWTPHFSLFGANSGFDSVEECFKDYTKEIFALETGLSSDPAMNWRLSSLDNYTLISNSDAHSPSKIGREANVFDLSLNYAQIRDTLKNKDKSKFLYTVEFFPQEGKYHYDGHRKCNVCLEPKEARQKNNLCPRCQTKVTVGVMHRVEELSDREEGFNSDKFIPFKNLIPLIEIIAEAKGAGVATKIVQTEYDELIKKFGSEMDILLKVNEENLKEQAPSRIVTGILRVRNNKVKIYPGYDGEYGKIEIFSSTDEGQEKQLTFF